MARSAMSEEARSVADSSIKEANIGKELFFFSHLDAERQDERSALGDLTFVIVHSWPYVYRVGWHQAECCGPYAIDLFVTNFGGLRVIALNKRLRPWRRLDRAAKSGWWRPVSQVLIRAQGRTQSMA